MECRIDRSRSLQLAKIVSPVVMIDLVNEAKPRCSLVGSAQDRACNAVSALGFRLTLTTEAPHARR